MFQVKGQESWLLEINPTNASQIWSYVIFPGEKLMWVACWHSWSSTWILFFGGGSMGFEGDAVRSWSPVDLPLLARWLRAKRRAGCSRSRINSRWRNMAIERKPPVLFNKDIEFVKFIYMFLVSSTPRDQQIRKPSFDYSRSWACFVAIAFADKPALQLFHPNDIQTGEIFWRELIQRLLLKQKTLGWMWCMNLPLH